MKMNKYKKKYLDKKFYSYKKKRFFFYFLKNILKLKKLLNLFCFLNIFRYKKNVFLNFSNFLDGSILYKASCGIFLKKKIFKKNFLWC